MTIKALHVNLTIIPKLLRTANYKDLTIELWQYDTDKAFSILDNNKDTLHNSTLAFGSSLDAEYHAMDYINKNLL